jgi:hypothetical protein
MGTGEIERQRNFAQLRQGIGRIFCIELALSQTKIAGTSLSTVHKPREAMP